MHTLRHHLHCEVDAMLPRLTGLADRLFDHPELGHAEQQACAWLTAFLRERGFSVRENVADLPTAFLAEWGHGRPVVGLLCEYDALEGLGHGCGHHLQGPAILGAAAALAACLDPGEITLRVFGTPAEETTSGKLPMARAGIFDGLDVALMMHAGDRTTVDTHSLAMRQVDFIFHGVSAHAAVAPEQGVNALYGVLGLFNGIGSLREHLRPDVRLHGIITDGGKAANIIPERAAAQFYLRAGNTAALDTLTERVYNVARGAALTSGTRLDICERKAYDNKINVQSLNDALLHEAELAGATGITPPRAATGSTDFSCVTHRLPGACLRTAFVPLGTSSHSRQWVEAGKSPAAHAALLTAAKALAATASRLVRDPALMQAVRNEFDKAKHHAG